MPPQKQVQERIESIEGLVRELENVSDPGVRSLSKRLVQSLMDLHGAGLECMLEIVDRRGDLGAQIIDEMCGNDLVGSLLLLYGLHPLDLRTRVLQALDKTRPYLRSHGGNVELVGVSESGRVLLRLEGSCHGCPSSASTLRSTVEQAIYDAAPDATAIVVEGVAQDEVQGTAFVPVSNLAPDGNGTSSHQIVSSSPGRTEWEVVPDLEMLPHGTLLKQDVGGHAVLLCKLNEDFYAYEITCPGCGQSLEGGDLENAILACPVCRQRYDLVHAGRGVDISTLHLGPIPLLKENGRAKIAIASRVQQIAS